MPLRLLHGQSDRKIAQRLSRSICQYELTHGDAGRSDSELSPPYRQADEGGFSVAPIAALGKHFGPSRGYQIHLRNARRVAVSSRYGGRHSPGLLQPDLETVSFCLL